MTTIKTTCQNCGTVELGVPQLRLQLDRAGASGWYSFVCPACLNVQRRDADHRVVLLLQAAGVTARIETGLPPITEDEIEDFSRAIHAEPAPTRML